MIRTERDDVCDGDVCDAMPAPDSWEERARFAALQRRLAPMFARVFPDPAAPRTVVVVPSLTLDVDELSQLVGAVHYEERLLCLLLLLRLPATRVVFVSSVPIAPTIVEYYLRRVWGADPDDARRRLTLLSCDDASPVALTRKILDRPALLARIRASIVDPDDAHLTCFNATPLERTLAVRLGVPLYACDPALERLGTKSGSRLVFREAGVLLPPGFEGLRDAGDVADALVRLRREHPALRRAVVKLEEGFSGGGNAVFSYDDAPAGPSLAAWVRAELASRLRFVAANQCWERYGAELARMGGIVEAFVDGGDACSPSVQCRIDPLGTPQIVSTHDQVLGGATRQVYLGCTFPASAPLCAGLHDAARRIAAVLARAGVIGRFGIDFLSTRANGAWAHHAIEINLRKGGTTHPYLTLQLLTGGAYDADAAMFRTPCGDTYCYVASDNLHDPSYRALTPDALIDAAAHAGLQFEIGARRGIVFHLLGALSLHGKLGAACIAPTHAEASALFHETMALLAREAAA